MNGFARRCRSHGPRDRLGASALVGAALLGAGLVAGASRAAPPDAPLAPPDYSFDLASPTVIRDIVRPADVLSRGLTRPRPALRSPALGLTGEDDIDALSGPNADVGASDVLGLLFSVDRHTIGVALPDPLMVASGRPYNVTDQAARGHAAGDEFIVIDPFRRDGPVQQLVAEENNVLVRNNFDEGGTDLSAWPPTHASSVLGDSIPQDCVDAMARLPRREDDGRIARVYFSLTASSPSLPEMTGDAPSGADVFFAVAAPIRGACCLGEGQCAVLPESVCAAEGGSWRGPDTPCALCSIAMGACCIDQQCFEIARFQCAMMDGQFFEGTPCHEVDCDAQARGACCLGPGFCVDEATAAACDLAGGQFFASTRCADTPCFDLVVGACCTSEGCVGLVDDVICHALDGTFFPGRTCKHTDCEGRGACCLPELCVDEASAEQCDHAGGVFHAGERCGDVVCDVAPIPPARGEPRAGRPAGAAFPLTAGLTETDPFDQLATTIPCEPPAACCFPDACLVMDSVACDDAGGIWIEGYTDCTICTGVGACCLGDDCVMTRPATCDNAGGRWLGPGASCASCAGDSAPGDVHRFATHEALGLVAADDIDALIVFDDDEDGVFGETDMVLFSLTRGSPSLLRIPGASEQGAAADIFVARPNTPVALFAAARRLGLGAVPDDVDALTLVIEPEEGGEHGIRRCEP